jgi:glycine/D-amino acid oxidase-like deaminating enzyme
MQQENLEQSVSLWMATAPGSNQSTLAEDTHADVCIVGAGIAGLTTAYLLAKRGKSVIVLDDGAVGGGQTQRTTALLSNALDVPATAPASTASGKCSTDLRTMT